MAEITPNSNGTVSFEWQSPFGHANLEIKLTRYSFFVKFALGGQTPLYGPAASTPDVIRLDRSCAPFSRHWSAIHSAYTFRQMTAANPAAALYDHCCR